MKKQCMHCWQPGCTAACLTNAMYKTEDGPVIWRSQEVYGLPILHDILSFRYSQV